MIKNTYLLMLALGLSTQAFAAQSTTTGSGLLGTSGDQKTTISAEALGRGGMYSVNVDRLVTPDVALGAGVSYLPLTQLGFATQQFVMLPTYANLYFSQKPSRGFVTGGLNLYYSLATGTGIRSQVANVGTVSLAAPRGVGILPVIGAGYEFRSEQKWLIRAAGYLISSDTVLPAPTMGLSVGAML